MQLTFILHYSKGIHHWSFLQQEAIRYTKGIYKKWCPLQFPESFYINKKTFKYLEKTAKQYLKMAVTVWVAYISV